MLKFTTLKIQFNFNYGCRMLLLFTALLSFGCKQSQKETAAESKEVRPNVLLIVADDLGFSDIAPFGGNIQTPALSQMAGEGLAFSNFHVQPTCSPTRSSLLTGNDNHVAGLGIMSETDYPALHQLQLPGYSGALSKQVVTIPEILRDKGYHTYMTGKWHLGEGPGEDPFDRGFEETYILGTGGGSHFNDKKALSLLQHMDYTRNGKPVEPDSDFYSTKNYTDLMIGFIDKNKADNKPFFGYLSYTAVHDPLQAPKEYIDKYKGKFDMGWDSLWVMRLNSLKTLGLIPADLNTFSKNPAIPAWEKLSAEQKINFAKNMEVYAASLEYLDYSIGRVIAYLKQQEMYDNTMIIFMSDNGANGAVASTYPGNEDGKYFSTFDNSLENRGLKNSYVETGPGWAQASSSPYRYFKSFTTEGGIKAPLLIKMPGKNKSAAQWNHSFVHVTDILPTILEVAGATYPEEYKGQSIHPFIGTSLMGILNGKSKSIHENDGFGWELFEMKAYIKGNFKIVRLPQPMGSGDWELYDLSKDPGETTDISHQFPEIKKQLMEAWLDYAKKNEVFDHNGHFDSIYRKSYVPKDIKPVAR